MSRRTVIVLVACWFATRLLLVATALDAPGYPAQVKVIGDVRRYGAWAAGTVSGERVPLRDFDWEYPAGALVPVVVPRAVPGSYLAGFLAQAVLLDGTVLALLLALARRNGSWRGAAFWVAATAALGPVAVMRLDSFPAMLAVAGAAALSAGTPFAAGLLIGGGTVAKLWPAALLVAAVTRDNARHLALGTAVAVGAAVAAVAAFGGLGRALSFATYHSERGLQSESVAATPLLWASRATAYRFGAVEVVGGGVGTALAVTTVASLLAVAAFLVMVRLRRADWAETTAAGLLLVLVCGKVLSPQFLLWPFALVAVALTRDGSRLRPVAPWLVVAAALTQVVYPMRYLDLQHARPVAVAILTLRNAILVGVAWYAARAVLRRPA